MKGLLPIKIALGRFLMKVGGIRGYGTRKGSFDVDSVAAAATILQISEYQFFQVAYEQWFGGRIPERMLDAIFKGYMFEEIVPFWVRQFTRKVFERIREGKLDPKEFNILLPAATKEMKAEGIGNIIMVLIILVMFCLMLSGFDSY